MKYELVKTVMQRDRKIRGPKVPWGSTWAGSGAQQELIKEKWCWGSAGQGVHIMLKETSWFHFRWGEYSVCSLRLFHDVKRYGCFWGILRCSLQKCPPKPNYSANEGTPSLSVYLQYNLSLWHQIIKMHKCYSRAIQAISFCIHAYNYRSRFMKPSGWSIVKKTPDQEVRFKPTVEDTKVCQPEAPWI